MQANNFEFTDCFQRQIFELLIVFTFLFLFNSVSTGQIAFQEVAAAKNVQHANQAISIGGGVSVYDFTGDGLDDLTLATNKGRLLGFYVNKGTRFEKI
ncbi:MAG: hypothetical protein AAGJ18_17460, partial [Bacteroidota bacterium]